MRRPPVIAVPLAAAVALLAAAPAVSRPRAPRVVLDPGCYLSQETGLLTGTGFAPGGRWSAKLGERKRIGTGSIDARGAIRARFTAPVYHGTAGTREMTLTVSDGRRDAETTFSMTPLSASFSPRTGDPASLRVRWRVLGLGPRHGVYVHYLRPDGTHRRTVRIGTTRGDCGSLKTGPIALFPFRYTYGRWTFQIDSSAHFSKATLPRLLIDFDIRRPGARRRTTGTAD